MALRASFTLVASLYIGPADAASGCNFALGTWPLPVQTVSKRDDLGFPLTQTVLHALAYLSAGIPGIQGFQHIVIDADDIHERERIPLSVRINGV